MSPPTCLETVPAPPALCPRPPPAGNLLSPVTVSNILPVAQVTNLVSRILLLPLAPTLSPSQSPLLVSPRLHSRHIGLLAISRTHHVHCSLMAFALDGPSA